MDKQSDVPLVSVIVPVYNTEKYLLQCINSLRKQTLRNIEIIIVDDGSTDGSNNICKALAAEDSRIRLTEQAHKGTAAARNQGIDLARSQYIMFVDSDDWVEPDFCEVPFRTAEETGADVVIFQVLRYGKGGKCVKHTPFVEEGFIPKEQVLVKHWTRVVGWSCNKLFRKELFDGIRYPEGHLYEDIDVTYRLIYAAKRPYLLNKYLYHYRDYRPGSTTNTRNLSNLTDSYMFEFARLERLYNWGYDCEGEEARLAVSYMAAFGKHGKESGRCDRILRKTRHITTATTWRVKLMFYVYKISPKLFYFLSLLTGRRVKGDTE